MAANAYHGDVSDIADSTDGFSTTTVYRHRQGWKPVATISDEEDGTVFLGRIAIGEHFIAMADIMAGVDGMNNAGVVYVFPTTVFPAAGE